MRKHPDKSNLGENGFTLAGSSSEVRSVMVVKAWQQGHALGLSHCTGSLEKKKEQEVE